MDEATFMRRFNEWQSSLIEREQYDRTDMPKYDELCALYLEATPEQRKRLPPMIAPPETKEGNYQWGHLVAYMHWVSERIHNPEDVQHLRLGIAAAALAENPVDWRDNLGAYAVLHHAARKAGINPKPHFKEIADMANPEARSSIRAFLSRSKRDIDELVRPFV